MTIPKNPVLLGTIIFVCDAALGFIIGSIWIHAIGAGIVGYSYSREKKFAPPFSSQIIAAVTVAFLQMLLVWFRLYKSAQFQELTALPQNQLFFMVGAIGFLAPFLLVLLGLSIGGRIGVPKK